MFMPISTNMCPRLWLFFCCSSSFEVAFQSHSTSKQRGERERGTNMLSKRVNNCMIMQETHHHISGQRGRNQSIVQSSNAACRLKCSFSIIFFCVCFVFVLFRSINQQLSWLSVGELLRMRKFLFHSFLLTAGKCMLCVYPPSIALFSWMLCPLV